MQTVDKYCKEIQLTTVMQWSRKLFTRGNISWYHSVLYVGRKPLFPSNRKRQKQRSVWDEDTWPCCHVSIEIKIHDMVQWKMFLVNSYSFFKIIFLEDIRPFCKATDTPALDFCPGFQSQSGSPCLYASLPVCFIACIQWNLQIRLWCNTCLLLGY